MIFEVFAPITIEEKAEAALDLMQIILTLSEGGIEDFSNENKEYLASIYDSWPEPELDRTKMN